MGKHKNWNIPGYLAPTQILANLSIAISLMASSPLWAANTAQVQTGTAAAPVTTPVASPTGNANQASAQTAPPSTDLTTDTDYQQQLADWQNDPHVRHVDNRTFLVYPSQNNHQIGTMLLFADWTLSASMAELAQQISKAGYDCVILLPFPQQVNISLLLPAKSPEPAPASVTNAASTATGTAVAPVQPQTDAPNPFRQALLDEWSRQLTQIQTLKSSAPGHTIWVSQGNQAAWLMEWLPQVEKQASQDAPEAIILLDAFTAEPTLNQNLANAVASWSQPVLDLYQQQGPLQLQQAVSFRAIKVQQQNKLTWRQRDMMPSDRSGQIVGWLRHLGWQ